MPESSANNQAYFADFDAALRAVAAPAETAAADPRACLRALLAQPGHEQVWFERLLASDNWPACAEMPFLDLPEVGVLGALLRRYADKLAAHPLAACRAAVLWYGAALHVALDASAPIALTPLEQAPAVIATVLRRAQPPAAVLRATIYDLHQVYRRSAIVSGQPLTALRDRHRQLLRSAVWPHLSRLAVDEAARLALDLGLDLDDFALAGAALAGVLATAPPEQLNDLLPTPAADNLTALLTAIRTGATTLSGAARTNLGRLAQRALAANNSDAAAQELLWELVTLP